MVIWAKTDARRNASEKSTSVDQGKYLRLYFTKKLSIIVRRKYSLESNCGIEN